MTNLVQFSHHPLVHALGWSLLHFCWQGTVVAILLGSVLKLLYGQSPQIRYAAACCALASMVVLPLATFARLAVASQLVEVRMASAGMDRVPMVSQENTSGTPVPWLERMARKLDQSLPWVLCGWFAGVFLLVSRLNLGLIAARRMKFVATRPVPTELQLLLQQLSRRMGVERTIKLASSTLVQVPTVVGWFRPVILIPLGCLMGLSSSQVEAVLAHELAHIRRHDYLVSVFQSVAETLLFYHPAVWWVSQRIRLEREHCCDDLAVGISRDALGYAKALSFLEERRASVPMVALGANGGVLAMRIRRLLGYKETPAVPRPAAITFLAVVIVTAGLCIGTVAGAASPQAVAQDNQGSQNLPVKYQKWLDEDVVWIIAPEEQAAFSQLKTSEERDKFVEQFWLRRSPTPNGIENKFKEEHYRRIAFANIHFASGKPGWKTDRGRIYIVYGAPDQVDSHPVGGASGFAKPTEEWRYQVIREHGVDRKDVEMQFVDVCSCGDYQLQTPTKN
jgi:GWxTD domain-containing protein